MSAKKIHCSSVIGQQGVNLIEKVVLEMGYLWYPTGGTEAGIDGSIEIRDPETGEVANSIVQVQSKATANPFQAETESGFDYLCSEKDLDYWMRGNAPVILVVSRPQSEEAYWVSIKDYFADPKRRAARKVRFDKTRDRFDEGCAAALVELAVPRDAGLYFAPPPVTELVYSNLLRVSHFPERLYVGQTDYRDRFRRKRVKLVVFGANGPTGRLVTRRALAEGHAVTAVTRRPDAFPIEDPHLRVAGADALDAAAVDGVVAGHDRVISTLGVPYTREPVTVFSRGAGNIVAAMGRRGLRRLVCVTPTASIPSSRARRGFSSARWSGRYFWRWDGVRGRAPHGGDRAGHRSGMDDRPPAGAVRRYDRHRLPHRRRATAIARHVHLPCRPRRRAAARGRVRLARACLHRGDHYPRDPQVRQRASQGGGAHRQVAGGEAYRGQAGSRYASQTLRRGLS